MKRINFTCACGEAIALEVPEGWEEKPHLENIVLELRYGFFEHHKQTGHGPINVHEEPAR